MNLSDLPNSPALSRFNSQTARALIAECEREIDKRNLPFSSGFGVEISKSCNSIQKSEAWFELLIVTIGIGLPMFIFFGTLSGISALTVSKIFGAGFVIEFSFSIVHGKSAEASANKAFEMIRSFQNHSD